MMNVKAIFFDIDGTLVSFKTHRIPQSALDAIRRVRAKGVKVFIATGRPLPFVTNLGDMEYDGVVSATGACLTEADGTIIHQTLIDKGDLVRLCDYHDQHPIPVAFSTISEIFMTGTNEATEEVWQLLDIHKCDIRPLRDCLSMDIIQIIPFFTADEEPFFMNDILNHCTSQRWHPAFADVICKGTSKASGIDIALKHYGIKLEETMAFGDGGNDISMLEHVQYGVAMGNASDAVKAVADIVTDSVDDDGVAKILSKL